MEYLLELLNDEVWKWAVGIFALIMLIAAISGTRAGRSEPLRWRVLYKQQWHMFVTYDGVLQFLKERGIRKEEAIIEPIEPPQEL